MCEKSEKLEQAEALGFTSVQEMMDHHNWLVEQKQHAVQAQGLVRAAEGQAVIDIRPLFDKQ